MAWEAEDIIRLRDRLNLTQHELGDKVGISQQAISQYESGETKAIKPVCILFELLEKELFGCSK